jgi:hypothetical protein
MKKLMLVAAFLGSAHLMMAQATTKTATKAGAAASTSVAPSQSTVVVSPTNTPVKAAANGEEKQVGAGTRKKGVGPVNPPKKDVKVAVPTQQQH